MTNQHSPSLLRQVVASALKDLHRADGVDKMMVLLFAVPFGILLWLGAMVALVACVVWGFSELWQVLR